MTASRAAPDLTGRSTGTPAAPASAYIGRARPVRSFAEMGSRRRAIEFFYKNYVESSSEEESNPIPHMWSLGRQTVLPCYDHKLPRMVPPRIPAAS